MKQIKLSNDAFIFAIDKMTAEDVYQEIYVDQVYLRNGIQLYDGDVVFDVGANIGLFSKYAVEKYRNLHIYAFEPIPQIFEALQANMKAHPSVKLFNIGLSDKKEAIEFLYYPKVSADSTAHPFDMDDQAELIMKTYHQGKAKLVPKRLMRYLILRKLKSLYKPVRVTCPLETLSDMIETQHIDHIDLLKLDAENAERQVLAGINDNDWKKIKQIAMEIHTTSPDGKTLVDDLSALLRSKGYSFVLDTQSRFSFIGVHMLYAHKHDESSK